ncbi:MAG: hypothetical protein ACK480_07360 [Planctomycetota bacterium]
MRNQRFKLGSNAGKQSYAMREIGQVMQGKRTNIRGRFSLETDALPMIAQQPGRIAR